MKPWFKAPPLLPKTDKISLIGGGICGLLLGQKLQDIGYDITIFEKNSAIMQEASGNIAGILDPFISLSKNSPENLFFETAFHTALEYYAALGEECFSGCGLKKIAKSAKEALRFKKIAAGYSSDFAIFQEDHILFKKSGMVFPQKIALKLSQNLKIIKNTTIDHMVFDPDSNLWLLYDDHDKMLHKSEAIILTGSYEIQKLTQAASFPLEAVKGQVSYLNPNSVNSSETAVLCKNGYLTPALNMPESNQSIHLLGATFEKNAPPDAYHHVTQKAHAENLAKIPLQIPSNNTDEPIIIGGRSAARAMSPDHLPLMGGVPDHQAYEKSYQNLHHGPDHQKFKDAIYHKSLYVCAGLGARGMLTAPYLTNLLVELITGHTPRSYAPSEPYIIEETNGSYSQQILQALHPARFHIRQLIKKTL